MKLSSLCLLGFLVSVNCFALPTPEFFYDQALENRHYGILSQITSISYFQKGHLLSSPAEIKNLLEQKNAAVPKSVVNKALATLSCTETYHTAHKNILTLIDYSLPSNEKRLWVFDLEHKKLLFHTYVSHGITSGDASSKYFSNQNNSKASSIGVYQTKEAYYGREGLSLRLTGLERGFNDNASLRSLVMHGGWYVNESFIKKYGRAGRSWGCPAVPKAISKQIIKVIKDDSLMLVYYPSDNWFSQSKYLTCKHVTPLQRINNPAVEEKPTLVEKASRDDILYVDRNKHNGFQEGKPILAMMADDYARIFNSKPPVERMLRRRIDHHEYIALSRPEFLRIIQDANGTGVWGHDALNHTSFVIAEVKMKRGYYETLMKIVPLGTIKEAKQGDNSLNFALTLDGKGQVAVKTTNQFIRWVGL